jgi:hypothetical protein
MEDPEETAIDAMNDALENGAPAEELNDDELPEIPLEDDEGGDDSEETDVEEDDGAEEDEGEVELGPDGKPLPKTQEKPGKKAADPVNDPIPKGLKQETSDRIRSLIKTTRDLTAERDRVNTEFNQIVTGIKSTGATPEQYGELLSWVSLFNSPNAESKRQAYQLVEDVAMRMALSLGIDRTAIDPVANYPDIKDALAKGQITPAYAKELARTREQTKFRGQLESHTQTTQQQSQQQQQELQNGRNSLNALEAQLKLNDPLYDRKRAQLVPVLKPVFAQLRPSQWAAAFQEAYKNVRLQRTAPAAASNRGQPMRAKSPAGSSAKQPGSALEAMNGALASMKP